jgi:S1-C subfamily serine protease
MPGFGEIAERLRRCTVQVLLPGERGGGSGIIWNSDGVILTNAHVARGRRVEILLWDGRRFPAVVTSRDPRRDLAALRIEDAGALGLMERADLASLHSGERLAQTEPGDSGSVRPGERLAPTEPGDSGSVRPGERLAQTEPGDSGSVRPGERLAQTERGDSGSVRPGERLAQTEPGDSGSVRPGERLAQTEPGDSGSVRPGERLAHIQPGDSAGVRPGELVIAIGNPLGFAGALSTGVVHSIGALPGMGRQSWIRADVRLAPGNSGGPLANADGQVIGINTAIVNGLGVAVPSNDAALFLSRGARPSLGVVLQPVSLGLLIREIDPAGAAAAASLRAGDVLLGSFDDLSDALDSASAVIRLRFLRGDRLRVREVYVGLEARAEAA